MLDISISKMYKSDNFNHPEIIKTLPYHLQEKENIPTITKIKYRGWENTL